MSVNTVLVGITQLSPKRTKSSMSINFTNQELEVIRFVIVNDLETLQNMVDTKDASMRDIGQMIDLNNALNKINKALE
jgi:predicted DNA-binding protein (UPF0251 family)